MRNPVMRVVFVLLIALLLPVTMEVRAAETGSCGESLTWTLDDAGILTISGTGPMTDYYYHHADGHAPWYSLRESIVSVVVEEGITAVGNYAFHGCNGIGDVSLPESLTGIGQWAFNGCTGLGNITLPQSVHSIGSHAFYGCAGLSSIVLPEGVTEISDYAFSWCTALEGITLPDSVTDIGVHAFWNCTSLSSITIPDSVTGIGESAFEDCENLNDITIPEGVTVIGDSTFSYCENLRTITLPEGITAIGASAFHGCMNLTDIVIPNSVTDIGDSAFSWCANLTDITLPEGITTIGWSVFSDCRSLSSITLPAGVAEIGEFAFYGCADLRSITIPESVTSIGRGAFADCTELALVNYGGSEAGRTSMVIEDLNLCLESAIWYYEDAESSPPSVFADITAGAYYYDAVLWAVDRSITMGTSETTFSPESSCTRGQIVTFLWRANGSPAPQSNRNPFFDVNRGDYFYEAVLWAVENGIATGMGDGIFAPEAGCTRGQVATFLWRSRKEPTSDAENIFRDIGPGMYYYNAVLWAVEEGITNGMGDGTFAPEAGCTRGQIVTFLHRAMQ